MSGIQIIGLILVCLCLTECSVVTDPRAPEADVQQKIPEPTSSDWKSIREDSEYTGHLFGGRLAFNWIVSVKLSRDLFSKGQAVSVGNLISSTVVLTSCRGAILLEKHGGSGVVHFAVQHLNESHVLPDSSGFFDSQGMVGYRAVTKVIKDQLCKSEYIPWDLSILKVNKPIFPFVPFIGFMPVALDFQKGNIKPAKVKKMKAKRTICHVAAFGRESLNVQFVSVELHYKLQYRAYLLPLADCIKSMNLLCEQHMVCVVDSRNTANKVDPVLCMGTRAKVGSVCDYDRGAPVVCEGDVQGIVLRGAQNSFCNNLIHLPFFVQKIETMEKYFDDYLKDRIPADAYFLSKARQCSTTKLNLGYLFILILTVWIHIFYSQC